ncbi:hypothetical protein QN277_000254 [Acacia crassicarpa]|uniref:AT3G52170-like helix-turn-helix domain-containing protein n=1 Tax=Acacia crassicarpa TaxID=499986 RepID=A0AAE1N648_9FABA|nr:hypothetical protein QN277_000254 [Acacia crassicarpa]
MRRKFLLAARGVISLSNHNLRLTRLSHSGTQKWVLIEAKKISGQSNTQWRGWSYAASVPSDKPNSQKRQRLSKDERRAMVESFVNKYRETNNGKFPYSKHVMKEVGGSYYVIREIIQELKYKSKLNSDNMDNNLVGKDNFNVNKLGTTETVKVPSDTSETVKKDRPIQDDSQPAMLDETDAGNEHLEDKRGPQTTSYEENLSKEAVITSSSDSDFIAAESDQLPREAEPSKENQQTPIDVKTEEAESSYSDFVVSDTHPIKEEVHDISAPSSEMSGSSQSKSLDSELSDMENHMVMSKTNVEKAEYESREHDALKDPPGIDGPKHRMEQVERTSDVKESKIDNSNRETSDAEAPKKTTLWGNLKSFADGIMNIWKKL